MTIRFAILAGCSASASVFATASMAQTCPTTQVQAVRDKYQPQVKQLGDDGDSIRHDASFSGKLDWKDQEFIFDTPTATMKTQAIVLSLPQVTMNERHIIFDTPSVRMVPTKIGQYPEFHGPFTIRWRDIITNVPETFMQRQDIETKIPEFRWDTTTVKFDVPEFSMQRQRVVLGLPQLTVTEIHLNEQKIADRSEALKDKATALKQGMGTEMVAAVHGLFECQRAALTTEQAENLKRFDDGIASLKGTIADLAAKGVNVANMSDGNGAKLDLNAVLADLVAKRAAAAKTFRDAADALDKSEKDSVAKTIV